MLESAGEQDPHPPRVLLWGMGLPQRAPLWRPPFTPPCSLRCQCSVQEELGWQPAVKSWASGKLQEVGGRGHVVGGAARKRLPAITACACNLPLLVPPACMGIIADQVLC